jgi:hypothetical protein
VSQVVFHPDRLIAWVPQEVYITPPEDIPFRAQQQAQQRQRRLRARTTGERFQRELRGQAPRGGIQTEMRGQFRKEESQRDRPQRGGFQKDRSQRGGFRRGGQTEPRGKFQREQHGRYQRGRGREEQQIQRAPSKLPSRPLTPQQLAITVGSHSRVPRIVTQVQFQGEEMPKRVIETKLREEVPQVRGRSPTPPRKYQDLGEETTRRVIEDAKQAKERSLMREREGSPPLPYELTSPRARLERERRLQMEMPPDEYQMLLRTREPIIPSETQEMRQPPIPIRRERQRRGRGNVRRGDGRRQFRSDPGVTTTFYEPELPLEDVEYADIYETGEELM